MGIGQQEYGHPNQKIEEGHKVRFPKAIRQVAHDDASSQAGCQQDGRVLRSSRSRVTGVFQKQNKVLNDRPDCADSQCRSGQDEPKRNRADGLGNRNGGCCEGRGILGRRCCLSERFGSNAEIFRRRACHADAYGEEHHQDKCSQQLESVAPA